jgi:hypothetical protein
MALGRDRRGLQVVAPPGLRGCNFVSCQVSVVSCPLSVAEDFPGHILVGCYSSGVLGEQVGERGGWWVVGGGWREKTKKQRETGAGGGRWEQRGWSGPGGMPTRTVARGGGSEAGWGGRNSDSKVRKPGGTNREDFFRTSWHFEEAGT